jgi:flagella basal body P-ring formation protein FlgA
MRTFETILASLVWATVALAAVDSDASADTSTITLRSTVLLQQGQPATLADIAHLAGEEALRLAQTPIDTTTLRPDPAGWRKIDAQALRTILEPHDPMWGAIQLRAGPTYIRTFAAPTQSPDQAPEPPTANTPAAPGTVRQLAEHHIARVFKTDPKDLQVLWVEATEGLLDHSTKDLLPHIDDAGRSDRMALRITLYDREANVIAEGSARAQVRIRRDVAVLSNDVPRRRIITPTDFRIERRWTDATENPADTTTVAGREAASNLKAGQPIRESDVHTRVAVKRGDRVQIRIITPTVTASLLARALRDARIGETIEFESIAPSRADRLRFEARVDSAGSAVAVAGGLSR